VLKVNGWEAAHATLPGAISPPSSGAVTASAPPAPVRVAISVPAAPVLDGTLLAPQSLTVGEYIRACEKVAITCSKTTFRQYANALRWIASRAAGLEATNSKYDYVHGGLDGWRQKVEAVPLASLTSKIVNDVVTKFIMGRNNCPAARRTGSAMVRQAKGLWSRDLLRLLPFDPPNPWEDVRFKAGALPKYRPEFDGSVLHRAATAELRAGNSELWKAYLLLSQVGLRRGEADRLRWKDINAAESKIAVVEGKTKDSVADVNVGPGLLAELNRLWTPDSGDYVLAGFDRTKTDQREYRALKTWDLLIAWLHAHGVTERSPLHALRKEFGSKINAQFGVHAAASALRHKGVQVATASYVDSRRTTVIDIPKLDPI